MRLFLLIFSLLPATSMAGPPPVITVQPLDQGVALGGTASFTVTVTSGTALSYQWYKDGLLDLDTMLMGQTSNTLTMNNVGLLDPGTFYVEIKNAGGMVTSRHASLNLVLLNRAPVGNNDIYTTPEDAALNIPAPGVLANDTDADNNALSAVLVSTVAHGSLSLDPNGSFTYTPALNYNGSDSFTYTAYDGSVTGNVATVTLNITPVDDPPIANNDIYSTPENISLTIPANGVLANDSYVKGQALAAVLVTDVPVGKLNLNADGAFAYLPPDNFAGSVSFTYRAAAGDPVLLEQNSYGGDDRQISAGGKSAQSFRHGSAGEASYMISKIVLYLSRRSGGSGNLNVSVGTGAIAGDFAGSSRSIGAASITDTSDGNSFQTYPIVYEVPIGPFAAGTTYYLNLDNQASERFYVEYPNNNTYANGTYYEGGVNQGKDMRFQIYETLVSNPATVTINVRGSAPLTLTPVGMTASGFELTITGPPVAGYVIEASTDLTTWTPIATNTGANGPVAASISAVFVDTDAGKYSQRFYRVQSR